MKLTTNSRTKSARKPPRGFTLVEIMITISIIGLLATLAMPFWWRARQSGAKSQCINNLRIISIGKELYALNEGKANGAPVTAADLNPYLKRPYADLVEPFSATYEINNIGIDPTCTYGSPHVLP